MSRNPYLNRVAIKDPAQFFGRAREISKIFSRLTASRPQSISIVGERRIGKSSLLNYVNHPQVRSGYLDQPDAYVFVFIDLQQKRKITLPEFFRELFDLMAKELADSTLESQEPTFAAVRSLLERL